MPDVEEIIKLLVMFGGFMGIIVGAGFGFKKLGQKQVSDLDGHATGRLGELESRVAELEERLDFSERMLADVRERERLPPSP
jgi:hypothetical protein